MSESFTFWFSIGMGISMVFGILVLKITEEEKIEWFEKNILRRKGDVITK